MKKKHELLKHAYDNYPKGTKFIGASVYNPNTTHESSGIFSFADGYFGIINTNGNGIIYDGSIDKWATIVPEKTAVKVNNEFELEQMYKAFPDYKEMVAHYGFKLPLAIEAKGFVWVAGGAIDYNIIDYADFALEKGLALKPTEIKILIEDNVTAVINKESVCFDIGMGFVSAKDIEAIHSAMQSIK